ncbi:MAG: nucleoside triphosphate pyrophosphohydrolase [Ignavibacteriales bacterium]|nr:nucleoside triphosphate pyrophosphohydrolase [Ignavibacteriales bacterium]
MVEKEFLKFVEITKRLRKECPWDKEQTHTSIRHSLIEETYEVVEALDNNDMNELKRELGDLLLHVVFHANIAEEKNEFTLTEVIDLISAKLIFRHPHIFGDTKVKDTDQIIHNWEKLKMKEGRESLMDGVPKELPALLRAHRLTDKAARVGFDWEKKEDAWKKVDEEMIELHQAIEQGDQEKVEEEFGDLLFAMVNYSRFIKVNPENALRQTVDKFISRFQYIEKRLKEMGKDIHSSSLEEMDGLWNEAKLLK